MQGSAGQRCLILDAAGMKHQCSRMAAGVANPQTQAIPYLWTNGSTHGLSSCVVDRVVGGEKSVPNRYHEPKWSELPRPSSCQSTWLIAYHRDHRRACTGHASTGQVTAIDQSSSDPVPLNQNSSRHGRPLQHQFAFSDRVPG